MILTALHVIAIGALVVLVRRQLVVAAAAWRGASVLAGAAVAVALTGTTQRRVHEVVGGLDPVADTIAAAAPAGDLVLVSLLVSSAVLALPALRRSPVRTARLR